MLEGGIGSADCKCCIFLPGDNTVTANTAVYNSQLGRKLYEGHCQGGSSTPDDNTWIVYLNSIYSIHNLTFFFKIGKQYLDEQLGTLIMSPSNYSFFIQ